MAEIDALPEYLMDMRGLIVHTWPITHSNVAELLPYLVYPCPFPMSTGMGSIFNLGDHLTGLIPIQKSKYLRIKIFEF